MQLQGLLQCCMLEFSMLCYSFVASGAAISSEYWHFGEVFGKGNSWKDNVES